MTDTSGVRHLLAEWQSRRLAETYSDFRAQARYRPAVDFFLRDLYGPLDFSRRDADIERVFPLMARVLAGRALEAIRGAIELHRLSQDLDARMAKILVEELSVTTELDAATYDEAFRRCGDRAARLRQIELVERVGHALDDVARNPVIYATARAARLPARLAGFGELQDFVERGLDAFRTMHGAEALIAAIGDRERRMLDVIFAGAATGTSKESSRP